MLERLEYQFRTREMAYYKVESHLHCVLWLIQLTFVETGIVSSSICLVAIEMWNNRIKTGHWMVMYNCSNASCSKLWRQNLVSLKSATNRFVIKSAISSRVKISWYTKMTLEFNSQDWFSQDANELSRVISGTKVVNALVKTVEDNSNRNYEWNA